MGRIKDETIRRFQEAVKKEYRRELTFEEASEILHGVCNYFYLLYKIDSRPLPIEPDDYTI